MVLLSQELSHKHFLVPPTPSPSPQLSSDSSSSHIPSPVQSNLPPKYLIVFFPFPELLDTTATNSTGLLHQLPPDRPHTHPPQPADKMTFETCKSNCATPVLSDGAAGHNGNPSLNFCHFPLASSVTSGNARQLTVSSKPDALTTSAPLSLPGMFSQPSFLHFNHPIISIILLILVLLSNAS